MFQKWHPNIEEPPLDPHRPPFKPATERQEAFLLENASLLAECDAEIERLRALKANTGGVS